MGETETASTDDVSNILTRIDYENEEDIERLRTIFLKYSTYQDENDDWMINVEDFFNRFLGVVQYGEDKKINRQTLKILSRTVNCNEDGYISFDEFKNFEQLLSRPDAIFEIAFRLFDIDRSQSISFEEFKRVLSHTNLHSLYPFNFSSEFVHLHFGEGNNLRRLRYKGFTQLLVDLHEEHSIQAFRRVLLENRQLDNTSYSISSEQLHDLLIKSQPHLMSDWLSENLTELNCPTDGKDEDDQVSFVWYFSLISLLRNTELLRRIFERSFKSENFSGIDDYSIKKDDFLSCALQFPQISPLQIDILFRIAQLRRTGNSTISSSSSSSSSGTGTITTSSGTVITPPHSNSQTTLNLSDIRAITPLTEDDMPFRKSARRHFEQQQQQQHHQTYWQKASESVYS
ncbi:hypothetical protein SNEBB_006679 [Seison nebaliae]|nr:hypothetical protein SNEBB_006679 [Seison nebaliae]